MSSTSNAPVYYEDIPPGALNESEFICTERITPRKIKPQNIVMRLMDREIYGSRKPGSHFHVVREFYQNVFPNLTIVNVEKPPCFLRKFSPDGKHFIAFSADQTSLEVKPEEYQSNLLVLLNCSPVISTRLSIMSIQYRHIDNSLILLNYYFLLELMRRPTNTYINFPLKTLF